MRVVCQGNVPIHPAISHPGYVCASGQLSATKTLRDTGYATGRGVRVLSHECLKTRTSRFRELLDGFG
jgi:hypothetical protein